MLVFFIDVSCDGISCAANPPLVSSQPAVTRFTGVSWSDCHVQARKHGWVTSLGKHSTLCPCCAKQQGG